MSPKPTAKRCMKSSFIGKSGGLTLKRTYSRLIVGHEFMHITTSDRVANTYTNSYSTCNSQNKKKMSPRVFH